MKINKTESDDQINNNVAAGKRRGGKRLLIGISAIVLAVAIAVGGFAIYAADYYRADMQTIAAMSEGLDVKKTRLEDGSVAYGHGTEEIGFIFYPGGKVEHTAYEPLMMLLASRGIFCVLVKMPFNLAVLDINAANGVREQYSKIDTWYIGGHSLGGSMAAAHAEANTEEYKGLILLGAYSTSPLADTRLDVLCLHGSEDKVMNRQKHDDCKENLPANAICVDIEGGCHAYFGSYGKQAGDGEPTISAGEQITITANSIYEIVIRGE